MTYPEPDTATNATTPAGRYVRTAKTSGETVLRYAPRGHPPPRDPVRVGLHKVTKGLGSYVLRGTLPDGRVVEVFCNQHKSRPEDPDFWVEIGGRR